MDKTPLDELGTVLLSMFLTACLLMTLFMIGVLVLVHVWPITSVFFFPNFRPHYIFIGGLMLATAVALNDLCTAVYNVFKWMVNGKK